MRLRKLTDAQGKPIDPGALYTPIASHGRIVNGAPRVYNVDEVTLRGDHEAVQAAPQLWISEKGRLGGAPPPRARLTRRPPWPTSRRSPRTSIARASPRPGRSRRTGG